MGKDGMQSRDLSRRNSRDKSREAGERTVGKQRNQELQEPAPKSPDSFPRALVT